MPHGRWTSYKNLQEFLFLPKFNAKNLIVSALRKCQLPGDILPRHRVKVSSAEGGIAGLTNYGTHMREASEADREAMLVQEGARLDRNGRLLGIGFSEYVGSVPWYHARGISVC